MNESPSPLETHRLLTDDDLSEIDMLVLKELSGKDPFRLQEESLTELFGVPPPFTEQIIEFVQQEARGYSVAVYQHGNSARTTFEFTKRK